MTRTELEAALTARFGTVNAWKLGTNPVVRKGVVSEFSELVDFYEGSGFVLRADQSFLDPDGAPVVGTTVDTFSNPKKFIAAKRVGVADTNANAWHLMVGWDE